MNIQQPLNAQVLSYLTGNGGYMCRKQPLAPVFAVWNSLPDPYMKCGCHPEIVERLWDQIGPKLPTDCRGLVHSNPALVHSRSGVILAIGMGTWYGLRLPGTAGKEAAKAGAETFMRWSTGDCGDIRLTLGENWVFGGFLADEPLWCKTVYDLFDYTS